MKGTLEGGAELVVQDIDGERLTFACARAFAPGEPLVFQVEGRRFDAKAMGSKRREDGAFDVKVRLVNLRRDDRSWLDEKKQ